MNDVLIVLLSLTPAALLFAYCYTHLKHCERIAYRCLDEAGEYCEKERAAGILPHEKINAAYQQVPDLAKMTAIGSMMTWDEEKLRSLGLREK